MPYVYILSDYREEGAENVCATLDRNRVPELFGQNWSPTPSDNPRWQKTGFEHALARLAELLQKPDEELCAGGGWECSAEFRGPQLHVARLE